MLYETNPLNDDQKSRYLHLNILAINAGNKNLDEIKASQKQIVSVPKDFTKLFNVIKMYQSMATILFGAESALVVEMGRALALIEQDVSSIKVRIAGSDTPQKSFTHLKSASNAGFTFASNKEATRLSTIASSSKSFLGDTDRANGG
jgi:hypothetical protein